MVDKRKVVYFSLFLMGVYTGTVCVCLEREELFWQQLSVLKIQMFFYSAPSRNLSPRHICRNRQSHYRCSSIELEAKYLFCHLCIIIGVQKLVGGLALKKKGRKIYSIILVEDSVGTS